MQETNMTRPISKRASFILQLLRVFVCGCLLVSAMLPACARRAAAHRVGQDSRPNILIIMTDDQSHDTMTDQFMPFTKSLIADQGINFRRAYISTPICCPSRASFLTGKYAANTGVHVNKDHLKQTTLVNRLHDSGYYTGITGKYLNSWPADARPEFDYWVGWKRDIVNPEMNLFGVLQNVPGYMPYIIRDYAMDFLDKVPADKPFFLMFTPVTPHNPATPAPGDENLYSDLAPFRPPNFNPAQVPGKPKWLQDLAQLTPDEIQTNDKSRLDQMRCLHSIDQIVKDLINKLRDQGKLDNTLIVFYSDNGLFWAEHRLGGKNRVYEEASRVPFALRFPPLVSTPRLETRLIQVIDLAPTIYDLAGISTPPDVDGRSLVPLMQGTTSWRDAILLEGWPGSFVHDDDEPRDPSQRVDTQSTQHYRAIRTEQYVYVRTSGDQPELYDTNADPYELNNLVDNADFARVVKQLKRRLRNSNF